MKRFTTTPHHDMTITSKVRTVLMEGDHYDLVTEQLVDAIRDIEAMARTGLKAHADRLQALENAERERPTNSTVLTVVKSELSARELTFTKWVMGSLAAGLGALLLAAITWLTSMAWKGMTK